MSSCLQDVINPGDTLGFATGFTFPIKSLFFVNWAGQDVLGQANVHSSQQVHVAAKLVCRDAPPFSGPSNLVAVTDLPVIDVR